MKNIKSQKMTSKIEMTFDEMEIFFQKSLKKVQSRPKRVRNDAKMIRSEQKFKIDIVKNESKAKKFSFASNFLLSILTLGTSNEGTPV